MDNHASNPAGRLLLYFGHLWTAPEHDSAQPHAATYLGLLPGYSEQYLKAAATLVRLPGEVEALVAQLDDPPIPATKLLKPLAAVRSVVEGDPLANNTIAWVKQQVNSTVMSELDSTSHILNRYVTRGSEISEDALTTIRALAEEIIALAKADEGIDAETRAAFIRYAHRITEAADLYKVTGPQPLIDELDRFHQEARRMKTPPGVALWEKTKQLTAAVVLAVELFMMPVNVDNALEYYGDAFTQHQITEAPGEPVLEVIEAEVVQDDGGEAA